MRELTVLGLGRMGRRIAVRLAAAGNRVVGWNRSPVPDFAHGRVEIAASAREAVGSADAVILSLHDAVSSKEVLFGRRAAAALPRGSLVIDMGTNSPSAARAIREGMPGERGYCDAPVSGGTAGAEQGNLAIFLGAGPEEALVATEVLAPLGRVAHMGGVGAGQAAKLANQAIVACNIAGLAEGFAAARALGLSLDALIPALEGGFADSHLLRLMGPRIAAGDFEARGRAATHLKDLDRLLGDLGSGAAALTATGAARGHLEALIAAHGDLDHSGMFLAVEDAMAHLRAAETGGDIRG